VLRPGNVLGLEKLEIAIEHLQQGRHLAIPNSVRAIARTSIPVVKQF
jgi:hypothetical protein